MEFIIEIIFEIFGEILDSTDVLYEKGKVGRKWKFFIHTLSIFKIIFFAVLAVLFLLLGVSLSSESTDGTSIVWAIICFLLVILFVWMTRCSIKAYKKWKIKIAATINDKSNEPQSGSTSSTSKASGIDNAENIADSEEAFNEWLYGDNRK